MKTSELTGCTLDWAVAKCEGLKPILYHDHYRRKAEIHGTEHLLPFHLEHQENIPILVDEEGVTHLLPCYSEDWAAGGTIIEKEGISIVYLYGSTWGATTHPIHKVFQDSTDHFFQGVGQTPIIAAMRCYVASKLGSEIELPEDLK